MRIPRTSALLTAAAVLLAACTAGRPTREDYLEVIRQTVRVMEQDARSQGLGRRPMGPLWVDVRGFAGQSVEVTGARISKEEVLAALGDSAREAEPRQVLLASTDEDVLGGTWVREYGVHVSPNAARGTSTTITMLVGSYSTDRRALPTTICDRLWRLRFRRTQAGSWELAERTLTRPCQAAEAS
jgi:hypothetical protein